MNQTKKKVLKSIQIVLITLLSLTFNQVQAQSSIPQMHLKSIEGTELSTEEIFAAGQPILIVFWATWCTHTTTGLNNMQDDYLEDWINDFDLKVVVISVDDAKTSSRAITVVNGSGWDYEVYLDQNGDFRRAMVVTNAPHMVLLNNQSEIIWQKSSYLIGDEELIQEELDKLN